MDFFSDAETDLVERRCFNQSYFFVSVNFCILRRLSPAVSCLARVCLPLFPFPSQSLSLGSVPFHQSLRFSPVKSIFHPCLLNRLIRGRVIRYLQRHSPHYGSHIYSAWTGWITLWQPYIQCMDWLDHIMAAIYTVHGLVGSHYGSHIYSAWTGWITLWQPYIQCMDWLDHTMTAIYTVHVDWLHGSHYSSHIYSAWTGWITLLQPYIQCMWNGCMDLIIAAIYTVPGLFGSHYGSHI